MAKKKTEEPNLFDNPTFTSFEVEGEENKNKSTNEIFVKNDNSFIIENDNSKELVVEKVTTTVVNPIDSFKLLTQPLIEKALKVVTISTDDENSYARELGKELSDMKKQIDDKKKSMNKPLKDEIDANNEKAKAVIEPLENQINRFKDLITKYELEKENKRKEELRRIEEEKRKREEAEKKEMERISKIRSEIQRLRELSSKSINNAITVEELNKVQTNLDGWKPKQEFFQEFFDEVNTTLRSEIQNMISGRYPIVKELEEQRKKAAELEKKNKEAADIAKKAIEEKLAAEKKEQEQKAALKKAKEDAEELSARGEIIVLVASFGIHDTEPYIEKIIQKYGNYRESVKNRDAIIKTYQEEQEKERQLKNLESQKMKNQRVDYIFEVIDENLVPREFLCVDESKVKKAIQENRALLEKDINGFKIDGIKISSKTQTVLKK